MGCWDAVGVKGVKGEILATDTEGLPALKGSKAAMIGVKTRTSMNTTH